mmetsp:Transcript_27167/g.49099  ORF Transcript_27167/g.49099 Transcript_27167/m.49099 type:complete len:111 (-) Transcript_27167:1023-1355(-)
MPIKQTTSLVGTRDIKLLPDYSSGINCFLQLLQVVVGRKNLFMLGNTNPITDLVEVNLLGIEDDIHPHTFHRMQNKMLLYDVSRPFDRNESRANLFPTDLSDYIGLSTPT